MRLNKLAKKIFAAGLAVSLMMANAGVSFADYPAADQATGTTTNLDKLLIMDQTTNIPTVDFTFTLTAGAAESGETNVYPGIVPTTVPDIKASFNAQSESYTPAEGEVEEFNSETEKCYKAAATIDLTGVKYPEPGIYRYTITEAASTVKGIVNDSETTRTMDVYVTDTDGKLAVASTIIYKAKDKAAAQASTEEGALVKTSKFVNRYVTQKLTLTKTVTGNQGSKDKYFKFTVNITGAAEGTEYNVDISHADTAVTDNLATDDNYNEATNPTKVTAGTEAAFYLHHGQSIIIQGLAEGVSYVINETEEDYNPTYVITDGNDTTEGDGNTTSTKPVGTNDITVAFTNNKQGTIPTGVILDSAPFLLIIGLAAAALIFTAARKKVR